MKLTVSYTASYASNLIGGGESKKTSRLFAVLLVTSLIRALKQIEDPKARIGEVWGTLSLYWRVFDWIRLTKQFIARETAARKA